MDNPEKTIVIDTAGESQPADMKRAFEDHPVFTKERPDIVGFQPG